MARFEISGREVLSGRAIPAWSCVATRAPLVGLCVPLVESACLRARNFLAERDFLAELDFGWAGAVCFSDLSGNVLKRISLWPVTAETLRTEKVAVFTGYSLHVGLRRYLSVRNIRRERYCNPR